MKQIIVFILVLLFSISAKAQDVHKVGDTIQDFPIQILNYRVPSSSLKEVSQKLTIVDFWGTWCAPCIASIPKLKQLQSKYKDSVNFFLVSNEDPLRLARFVNSHKDFTLPIIVDADDTIFKLFKPASYPRYVILNDAQKVLAITDSQNINEENINALLNKEKVNLPSPKEEYFDYIRPLSGNDNLTYQSVLRPYLPGIRPMSNTTFPSTEYKDRRILCVNMTVPLLFQIAYKSNYLRMAVELKDASMSKFENTSNLFSYDLIVPETIGEKRFEIMQEDLVRNFPSIKAKYVNRDTKIYLLKVISDAQSTKLKSKGGKPDIITNWKRFAVYNQDLNTIGSALENFVKRPVVSETKLAYNLDFEFDANMTDVTQIRAELNKIGLDLIEAQKTIPILVIND